MMTWHFFVFFMSRDVKNHGTWKWPRDSTPIPEKLRKEGLSATQIVYSEEAGREVLESLVHGVKWNKAFVEDEVVGSSGILW